MSIVYVFLGILVLLLLLVYAKTIEIYNGISDFADGVEVEEKAELMGFRSETAFTQEDLDEELIPLEYQPVQPAHYE